MARRARDYKKEYREYHALPLQKRRRADRNAARRKAIKAGTVSKGDSREVDHIGSHRRGRLRSVRTRVISRHANRIKQPKRT
jgi:hypothetical protein